MVDTLNMPIARPGTLDNSLNVRVTLSYVAPIGHTLADVMDPNYFKDNLRDLAQQRVVGRHAWNRIEVIAEDGTWEAEFRVVEIGSAYAKLRLLRQWPEPKIAAPAKEAAAPDGYVVEYVQGNGWRALEPGGSTLIERRPTREEAMKRATEHASKVKEAGSSGGRK